MQASLKEFSWNINPQGPVSPAPSLVTSTGLPTHRQEEKIQHYIFHSDFYISFIYPITGHRREDWGQVANPQNKWSCKVYERSLVIMLRLMLVLSSFQSSKAGAVQV